ncbi:MAG: tripartite tricarboxylate transporter substrate binding protein [Pseudomonadota bacterium]
MFRRTLLTASLAAAIPADARAQGWPQRPVRILVPYPPGSGTDIIGRILAERLQVAWGQPVVVENRPGAGGSLGTEVAARAQPDGHTLLIADTGPLAIAPTLFARLGYDPVADFAPITLLARLAFVLVVNPSVSARDAAQFVALARAQPGRIAYASVGNGSFTHLAMELFRTSEGITLNHVPYRGSAPALNDVVGGQVSAMFVNTLSSVDLIRAGRLRALAIGSQARLPVLPEVPTLAEALGKPVTAEAWFGLLAPRGTPGEIVARIAADVGALAADPAQRARMEATGAEIAVTSPEAFAAMIREEGARWAPIVRASGAQVD